MRPERCEGEAEYWTESMHFYGKSRFAKTEQNRCVLRSLRYFDSIHAGRAVGASGKGGNRYSGGCPDCSKQLRSSESSTWEVPGSCLLNPVSLQNGNITRFQCELSLEYPA